MRLIDADAAKARLLEAAGNIFPKIDIRAFHMITTIADMFDSKDYFPTIEAQPVRHGRWVKRRVQDRHECSCCHSPATITITFTEYLSDYCPNCGARMDGDEDG